MASMPGARILFVGHEGTRTGAPLNLLHFLKYLKARGQHRFSILLGAAGELTTEFAWLADTRVVGESIWRPDRFRTHALTVMHLGHLAHQLEASYARRIARRGSPGLVYVNSIGSARIVELIKPEVPVLTHVHELEFMFRGLAGRPLDRLMTVTRRFIACSEAVRRNLIDEHRVPPEKVETVYESIPISEVRARRSQVEVFRELGIPQGATLVAGCGTVHWIKGPDLFVQVARRVCHERQNVYFVWVGGGLPSDVAQFEHDIRATGLDGKIRLTGSVTNVADYFAAADLFLLTSRQDSYPLSCLEAGSLEKPIICFAGAGGAPEFVEEDCGQVVPYLDVEAMAGSVVCLIDCTEQRLKMGDAAKRKVLERHDMSVAGPRIIDIIERTLVGS